jgi:hypothetical protein
MNLWETNYEQCFPVGVIKGEKVGQIDIIYVRGKFRQSTLGNSNWPQYSLPTHTMVGASPSMMDHLPPFSKRQIFQ